MDIKVEKICRICLKEVYKGFEVLDETAKHMFDVLLLKMNWDVSSDPMMCQECVETAKYCFSFKTACINNENIIRSLVPSTPGGICKDFNVCRFCMDQLETNRFVPLNTLTKVLEMLPSLMPEMDVYVTKNPLVCPSCRENLECYFKFAQNCTEVEEKIRKYCQDEGIHNLNQIKLSDIPVVKTEVNAFEQVLIKTEETWDVNEEECDSPEISSTSGSVQFNTDCHKTEVIDAVCTTKMYKCSVCAYETKRKRNLTSHSLIHKQPSKCSDTKMYKCSVCTFETKRKPDLARHSLIHKDVSEIKIYKCSVCTYETKRKADLTGHLLIHNNAPEIRMHKCSVCTYETKHKHCLTLHLLIHKDASEIKMYDCSICTYKSKRKGDLTKHILTHKDASETDIYKCLKCNYETKHKSALATHVIIHKDTSETKMYKCSVCTYETKHRRYLASHRLIHKDASETEIYRCSHCTYETKHKRNLTSHELTHKSAWETEMFKCPVCTFETKRRAHLARHSLIHKEKQRCTK